MVRRSNHRDLFRIEVRRMMEEIVQKNRRGILDLSPEILIKIFRYVGTMNPGDYISEELASTSKRSNSLKEEVERTIVKGMLNLRKVCRRFSSIIDSYAYYLPKFLLRDGIRIRSKPHNAQHGMVVVYRYGWKEKVTICTAVTDLPVRMSHFKVGGRLVVDDLFVDDDLITALTYVDLSKVKEVLFTRIVGAELRSETIMSTFLDQVRFAKSIRFFGNFSDDDLFLNDPAINEIVERNGDNENSYLDASRLDAIYRKSVGSRRKQRDKARRRAFNKRIKRTAKEEPLD
uniref:F-box domain-containing protein n=1 Tax=Parascaris univalens TaxID=6257 RepID=A0A914ZLH7_PARUN